MIHVRAIGDGSVNVGIVSDPLIDLGTVMTKPVMSEDVGSPGVRREWI